MRRIFLPLLLLCITVFSAGCFVYHKPAFEGQILDIDTKQPIAEVVVVAVYNKRTMGLGAGAFDSIINVREALTDSGGKFRISSYTTLINPFSWESAATFIVFKPGYASFSGLNLEEILSDGMGIKEVELPWLYNKDRKFVFASRLIGLPKMKTREEKWHAALLDVTGYSRKELPLLYEALSATDKVSNPR